MKSASAKAKGRALQQHVAKAILKLFAHLEPDDVKSTSMGAGGEDIQLSPAARRAIPISIECKNRASFAFYKDYEQAARNAKGREPVLVVKQNRSKPLAIIDLDYYLLLEYNRYEKSNS